MNAPNRVVNSTFINNRAGGFGGAVYTQNQRPTSLNNVTVISNTAATGGGLYVFANFATLPRLYNSIVSGNNASVSGDNCAGNALIGTEAKSNLFGTSSDPGGCTGFAVSSANNITATGTLTTIVQVDGNGSALLADNGGGTETIALVLGSPAVDTGDDNLLPNESALGIDGDGDGNTDDPIDYDQRTATRPAQQSTDIGAYELEGNHYNVNLSSDDAQSASVGDTVTYTMEITNTGFSTDTFNLALNGSNWPSGLLTDTVELATAISTTFQVTVSIPAGAAQGETDIVTVTVTSRGNSSRMDTAILTTTAIYRYNVNLSGDDDQSALAGDTVTYTVVITNTGIVADIFDLVISGNSWPSGLTQSTIELAAGISAPFQVTVSIPAGAAQGETDIVTVTVTSRGNNSRMDMAILTTTAIDPYNVNLSGDDDQSALAGDTVTYTVIITNTGIAADIFDLVISGNSWPSGLTQSTIELAAGINSTFQVAVNIPAIAPHGITDTVIVTATSQGNSSREDTANLTTTAFRDSYQLYLPIIIKESGPAPP